MDKSRNNMTVHILIIEFHFGDTLDYRIMGVYQDILDAQQEMTNIFNKWTSNDFIDFEQAFNYYRVNYKDGFVITYIKSNQVV